MNPAGGVRRRGRRLARALLWLVLLGVGAELAYRGWLATRGAGYSSERQLEQLRAQVGALALPLARPLPTGEDRLPGSVPHPFLGWDQAAQPVSSPELAARFEGPEAARAFDVLLLGGAAAEAVSRLGQESLRTVLERDPAYVGREVRVHYAGHPAFQQPQQVALLTYVLALGWEPDLVVEVDGQNELELGRRNARLGAHPLYPSAWHAAQLDRSAGSDGLAMDRLLDAHVALERARRELGRLEAGLALSALCSRGSRARCASAAAECERQLAALRTLTVDEVQLSVVGPAFDSWGSAESGALAARIAEHWAGASRLLEAICAERSIEYLHVLEPLALASEDRAQLEQAGRALAAQGVRFESAADEAGGPEALAARIAQAYLRTGEGRRRHE